MILGEGIKYLRDSGANMISGTIFFLRKKTFISRKLSRKNTTHQKLKKQLCSSLEKFLSDDELNGKKAKSRNCTLFSGSKTTTLRDPGHRHRSNLEQES